MTFKVKLDKETKEWLIWYVKFVKKEFAALKINITAEDTNNDGHN